MLTSIKRKNTLNCIKMQLNNLKSLLKFCLKICSRFPFLLTFKEILLNSRFFTMCSQQEYTVFENIFHQLCTFPVHNDDRAENSDINIQGTLSPVTWLFRGNCKTFQVNHCGLSRKILRAVS